jgi:ABC-type bacteriocin/lantibiotic exporter with double-glycine peptidase domain
MKEENIIIEFIPNGNFVKVCAIDIITHEEVSIVGDVRYGKTTLTRLAIQKLRHMQAKKPA